MENIQVAVRFRPLNREELYQAEEPVWDLTPHQVTHNPHFLSTHDKSHYTLQKPSNTKSRHKPANELKSRHLAQPNFQFDHVFDQSKSNEHIYSKVVQRVALDCLDGYNGTIFMYGQTGSGKTHTMLGYNDDSSLKKQSMVYPRFSMDLGQPLPQKKPEPWPSLFGEKNSVSSHGEVSNLFKHSDLSGGDCQNDIDLGIPDINQKCPELIYNYTKSSLTENNGILIQALKDIF